MTIKKLKHNLLREMLSSVRRYEEKRQYYMKEIVNFVSNLSHEIIKEIYSNKDLNQIRETLENLRVDNYV